jgi:hypothetical protein
MDGVTQSSVVTVECRGFFSEGPHTMRVTGFFDGGVPGCIGSFATSDTTAIVIGPPSIRLTKAADAEICFGSRQVALTFAYEKSASVRALAMGYTVTVNGQDRSTCSAAETGIGERHGVLGLGTRAGFVGLAGLSLVRKQLMKFN